MHRALACGIAPLQEFLDVSAGSLHFLDRRRWKVGEASTSAFVLDVSQTYRVVLVVPHLEGLIKSACDWCEGEQMSGGEHMGEKEQIGEEKQLSEKEELWCVGGGSCGCVGSRG